MIDAIGATCASGGKPGIGVAEDSAPLGVFYDDCIVIIYIKN